MATGVSAWLTARTDLTVYEQNSDQLFAPASVTKLFSTPRHLIELGADYRFETPVVRRGEIDAQGTLHGDLVLIAQGDLGMGGRAGADGTLLFKDDDHIYAGGNPRVTSWRRTLWPGWTTWRAKSALLESRRSRAK